MATNVAPRPSAVVTAGSPHVRAPWHSAPPSQKAGDRPITFVLEVDGRIASQVTLALRPEDLSRTDSSSVTVHHTLAGAWADNFGPGLASIQISGTTSASWPLP